MSASVYNNPYAYKPSFPKIQYPPLFAGLRKITIRHLFESLLLPLAAGLLIIAMIISILCVFSPYWFTLHLSPFEATFGDEAITVAVLHTGIFFYDENEHVNLMDLNKISNQDVVPKIMTLSQILEVIGVCMLVATLCGTIILALKRFSSMTALIFLAFFSSVDAVCFVFVCLFTGLMAVMSNCDMENCKYSDNLKWRMIPLYTQFYRIAPVITPYIKLDWTFFIAIVGALVTIAASVIIWIEALRTYNKLCQIRYTQLRTARSPYEGDVDPQSYGKQVYQPPVQTGSKSYGMQPVMIKSGPYSPQDSPPTTRRHSPPPPRQHSPSTPPHTPSPPRGRRSPPPQRRRSPSPPSYRRSPSPPRRGRRSPSPPRRGRRSPSPPRRGRRSPSPPRRGGPPSVTSSVSEGPFISREIDL